MNTSFEYFFNYIQIPFAILKGRDFVFTFANPAYQQLLNGRELVGKSLVNAIPELQGQDFITLLTDVYNTGVAYHTSEIPSTAFFDNSSEASTKYFNLSYIPFKNKKEVEGIIACGYDITEQVEFRNKIKFETISNEVHDVFLQSHVGIAILKGSDFIVELANEPYLEIIDKKKEEVVGKRLFDALPEIEKQGFKEMLNQVMETGETLRFNEHRLKIFRKGNLEEIYVNFVYQPLHHQPDLIGGIVVIVTEITDHVLARKKVEESEERFRSLADQAPLIVFMADADGNVTYWNKQWLELTGQTLEEALGPSGWSEVTHPDDYELLLKTYLDATAAKKSYSIEVKIKRCDGEYRCILFTGGPRYLSNGAFEGFVATGLDITNRKQAEKALEESEAQFRQMVDLMPTKISNADLTGNVYYFNNAFIEYTGLTLEELKNGGWIKIVHPEDAENASRLWMNAVETGTDFEMELRFLNKKGEYKWHLSRAVILKDKNLNLVKWIGVATEIHDQKLFSRELEKRVQLRTKELFDSNLHLLHSNENLEQFASIASHDLQEPLRKIQTFTKLIEKRHNKEMPGQAVELIEKIQTSSKRMSGLIKDVLNFSRITRLENKYVLTDLNEILKNVLEDLELLIQENNVCITKDELPIIEAIPIQINQLFFNLISNAIKFRRKGIDPVISISSRKLNKEEVEKDSTLDTSCSYHLIIFKDNGIGFDEQFAEDIFLIFIG
jgi:PAS domain S-box-containing protein